MLSKIPSLINTKNSKNSSSSSIRIKNVTYNKENKRISNLGSELTTEKTLETVSEKKTNASGRNNLKLPRVAYIKPKFSNDSMHSRIGSSKKVSMNMENRNLSSSICNNIPKKSKDNISICLKKSDSEISKNLFERNPILKNLNIRQRNLITEREQKLERTKSKLEEKEKEFNELKILSEVTESELRLQLEYLEEENMSWVREINDLSNFEKEYYNQLEELDDKLKHMEFLFGNLKRQLKVVINNNKDLSQKILDAEETIKLLSEEILESEKSIKLYELEDKDNGILVDSMRAPFNKSVEYALKLEKLIQNDKLLINQLQFKLHKFTKKPRFVCRTYSIEIPQTSKVFISIPNPNEDNIPRKNLSENVGSFEYLNESSSEVLKNPALYENIKEKFSIDIENKIFSVGENVSFGLDKIIEFDDSKRPSSLLLTDLSKIQIYLSNIMESDNRKNKYSTDSFEITQRRSKNTIFRRQSLLHTRTDIELENRTNNQELHGNKAVFDEKIIFYNIDINEQKEVEMDVLLLVNDMFNNIRLELSEKTELINKKIWKSTNSNFGVPSICFTNIGSSSTASRQTFWGTRSSRCIFAGDNVIKNDEIFGVNLETEKIQTPGILHSVIHQIYQNINNSSLFEWNFSADLFIQKVSTDHLQFKQHKDGNCERNIEFQRSLRRYIPTSNCYLESNDSSFEESNSSLFQNEIHCTKTVTYTKCAGFDEFISQIYKEIQDYSPNYLDNIEAYNFEKSNLKHSDDANTRLHVIVNLRLDANTSYSSTYANITLVDLYIDDNSNIDQCVSDYFRFVKDIPVRSPFIHHLYEINKGSQTRPLIYNLLHSNI